MIIQIDMYVLQTLYFGFLIADLSNSGGVGLLLRKAVADPKIQIQKSVFEIL
jgi:hypothetical protein